MSLYKVALHIDSRPLSTHIYLRMARLAKLQAGNEYNIYNWNVSKHIWEKL
jgi:hypothetical protein